MSEPAIDSRPVAVRVLQVAYDDHETVEARVARVADWVREQDGADLVVLPELWGPGYFQFPKWAERAETLDGPTVTAIAEAAADIGAVVHMGSLLERPLADVPVAAGARGLWNTSILLDRDGSRLGSYRKIHPFGFGDGEPTLIDAGTDLMTAPLTIGGADTRVGLATCYDLRFPELFRHLTGAGAEILIVSAAWPAARREHWDLLGRARAVENQAFVIQCNTGGSHGGVTLGGGSQVVSPTGEVLAQAGAGEETLSVDIDLAQLAEYRRAFPVLDDRRL